MMTKQTLSTAEYVFYYALIAISGVLIVLPAARLLPFAKVVVGLMILALSGFWIWRDRKRGDMNLTLPEIYAKARQGYRFTKSFELAATIVTFIAFWLTI